jgi:tetratricopeptide (TPR) repeat protein
MVRRMPTVAEWWEQAERAWRRRDAAEALAAVEALLALEPEHASALALAGALRVEHPERWAEGVAQLERALHLGVADERAVVTYAEALAAHGRARDAVSSVLAWAEAHPVAPAAWTALGWLLGVEGEEADAGRAALSRALQARAGYGDAHLALGRLEAKQRRPALAAMHFTRAIQTPDCRRPHEAWLRLGEAFMARGHLRRALGALRRAQEVDRRGEYTRPLYDGINALSHVLHQHGRFFLHVLDETLRSKALEAGRPVVALDAPRAPLSSLAARARSLRGEVREAAHTALEGVEAQASARALLPRWAEQGLCGELEAHGGEAGHALAASWRVAQADLYEELLEREEALGEPEAPLSQAQALGAARRWDEAEAALRAVPEVTTDAAVMAERWGDRLVRLDAPARAAVFYALAERAQAALQDEIAVERLRGKQRG